MTEMPQDIPAFSVAGKFYPADPEALARIVAGALAQVPAAMQPPLAVISPHAGYRFSGRLTAVALGATGQMMPRTIVVLSPAHRHTFDGIALSPDPVARVPTGDIPLDTSARDMLLEADLAHLRAAAHEGEHGIETQLPFLRALHPGASILPLVIGRASADEVARVVDFLHDWIAPLFVLSSDLSHFLPLRDALARDARTAKLLETGKGTDLGGQDACGARAIAGFLRSNLAQGARVQRLGLANSHAVTADARRTVGYGAWGLFPAEAQIMSSQARRALLSVARQALTSRLKKGKRPEVDAASFPPELQTNAASFVTLRQSGRLRGCIGSLVAHQPMVVDVVFNAVKAGFDDPRFAPLAADELDRTTIGIALLSPPCPLHFEDQADLERQLMPGRDGLILAAGAKRGTFLPMVWEQLTTPRAFVEGLKVKAGLPKSYWGDDLSVQRFHTESFAEGKTD